MRSHRVGHEAEYSYAKQDTSNISRLANLTFLRIVREVIKKKNCDETVRLIIRIDYQDERKRPTIGKIFDASCDI